MTLVATSRALVVVLGRRPDANGAELVGEAAALRTGLMLLFVGFPITPSQRAVEAAALDMADRLHTRLDVRLVLSARALIEAVGSDAVRLSASPSETRRIRRVLEGR
jgi:hypothetical protein